MPMNRASMNKQMTKTPMPAKGKKGKAAMPAPMKMKKGGKVC
jgi:hypothetical protein